MPTVARKGEISTGDVVELVIYSNNNSFTRLLPFKLVNNLGFISIINALTLLYRSTVLVNLCSVMVDGFYDTLNLFKKNPSQYLNFRQV